MNIISQQKPHTAQRHYELVAKALLFIEQQQGQQPSLSEVANHCAVSEYHFQRLFSEWTGISPKQFLQFLTREQARKRLLSGASLGDTTNDSGLSSSSRLHDLFVVLEAVTPGELKSGGAGMTFFYGLHPSPFGLCLIIINKRGIHRLDFVEHPADITPALNDLQLQWPAAVIAEDSEKTASAIKQIFYATDNHKNSKPLKLWLKGSQFQLKVWEALLRIPNGSVTSYAAIAETIGQAAAARAVGSAVGKNPIALLIPCHRVIQKMGILGNYRWGPIRKQAMLGWEAGQVQVQENQQALKG